MQPICSAMDTHATAARRVLLLRSIRRRAGVLLALLAWSATAGAATPPATAAPTTAAAPGPAASAAATPTGNADQALAASVRVGRPEWLEAAGERFLGIYTETASDPPHGGIILLPGMAAHADWPGVIHPLRRDLPAYGWATLSIQLPAPALAKDRHWELAPVFTTAKGRIAAAVAFLEKQGVKNIVVVGHDLGAAAAAAALAGATDGKIASFVAVGMGLPLNTDNAPYRPELLEQITVPMLDIYGSRDNDTVLQQASRRAAAARKGGGKSRSQQGVRAADSDHGSFSYRQLEVVGADHFFTASDQVLTKRIAGWLRKHAAGVIVPRTSSSDATSPG